jgi:hypothetical protein
MERICHLVSWSALLSILCILSTGVAFCQPLESHDFYPGDYSGSKVIGISLPGTWRPFSDDSPWNTPIKINPTVHPKSAAIMQRITGTVANIRLGNSFLPALWVVNQDNMEKHLTAGTATPFDIWDPDNDRISNVPAPINDTMWGEQTADGHISIIDPFHNMLWEMSRFRGISDNQINCSTFNIWDLTGKGVGDPNEGMRSKTRGGRGSGFPVIAGLIRPEEIQSGEIRHALCFTFDSVKRGDVYYPACRSDGKSDLFDAPAEGMLFQLNPELSDGDFDNWGLSNSAKIVARTLQKFGMYLCDCGGPMALQLQLLDKDVTINRQKWDEKAPGLYSTIKNIPTNQFRLIYTTDPVHSGAASIVTTPLISPVCGNFKKPVSITITVSNAWPDAQIHYTIDGSEPSSSSALYTGPFLLSASSIVKAKAYASNGFPSHIMKARINISATNATPKAKISL